MAVNDKIEDDIREEQSGFEMIDTILDKLNEVADVSTGFTSSVSGDAVSKVSFDLSKDKTNYALDVTVTIITGKSTTTKTGSIALK